MPVVVALLEGGADVNLKRPSGATALMRAAAGGHLAVVQELITRGADTSAVDSQGFAAVDFARNGEHHNVVEAIEGPGARQDPSKASLVGGGGGLLEVGGGVQDMSGQLAVVAA